MITRREVLVLAAAFTATVFTSRLAAEQRARTATVTLTIEGMT